MRKFYLMLVLSALFVMPTQAVKHENYIGNNDVKGWMYEYYGNWTPGQAPEGGAENENFYIGRVRPMVRFTNTATQVDQGSTRAANRKLLWWVPINQTDDGGWTSLPSYCFDSEAFSMWSYVTTYGNWTQGFLRQPGAFADVCHKNGVLTAVVSAAAWAQSLSATDNSHGQNYKALIDGKADKLLKLMSYYGIDGLGFNSEQSWGNVYEGMKNLMKDCQTNRANFAVGNRLHFDMYQFPSVLGGSGGSYDWTSFYPYANGMFLNYGWGSSQLTTSQNYANNNGGSIANSFDVYGGMDHQGRSSADWIALQSHDVSIGLWGAHNKNMIYESATEDGSTPDAIQGCYLRKSEQFFTGGTRNPINNFTVSNMLNSGTANFFGVSKLMAAKSALSWVTNEYFPFISYMNLGNGKFFNNEGETTYNNEWYNIGMQDHLPTWRWWITNTYMGRQTTQVPTDTKAEFTYEDAWFGGSCMKVSFDAAVGRGQSRYIQLYKTQFNIESDATYTLRIRYKVLGGQATMSYAMSKEGIDNTPITTEMGIMNQPTWTLIEKQLPTSFNNERVAQLGMLFQNVTAGTEILIGEVALVKNGVTYEPVTPTIDNSRTKWFKTTSRGVDFKVIWNCEKPEAASAPVQKAVEVVNATYCTPNVTNNSAYDRYTRVVGLTGSQSGTWTSGTLQTAKGQALYFDKTGTTITVKPGETLTPSLEYHGEWMHKFVFIDLNKDGDFEDTDEAVSYGYLASTGKNSAGTTVADSNTANPPSFTVPATEGTYRIRFKVDWGSTLAPCGTTNDFMKGGIMADFTLNVSNSDGGGGGTVTPPVTPDPPAASANGAPIYNDEVGTWYFEILAQQKGQAEDEYQLVTTTITWAGYAVEVPIDLTNESNLEIRAGVRAVAPDGVTKSEIAWSNWMNASQISVIEGFSVDKPVIKADEDFTISFDDERHGPGTFTIYDAKTNTQVGSAFSNVTSFTTSLATEGLYDVQAVYQNQNKVTVTEMRRGMIQVSSDEVGALPEIKTLTTDKEAQNNEVTHNEVVTLSYTGRPNTDGSTSRALRLQEFPFCVDINAIKNQTGYNFGSQAWTLSFWFNPYQFIDAGDPGGNTSTTTKVGDQGTQMISVRNPRANYPTSDWGYIWSGIHNGGNDFWLAILRQSQPAGTNYITSTLNFVIPTNNWTHVAVTITAAKECHLYINGRNVSAEGQGVVLNKASVASLSSNDYLYIGGPAKFRSGFDGAIDEVQLWKQEFNESNVNQTMVHYNSGSIPTNLVGYWDFEQDATSDNTMTNQGQAGTTIYSVVGKSWRNTGNDASEGTTGSSPMVSGNRITPTYAVGTPFLAGRYEVKTTPSWKFTGQPKAGSGAVGASDNGVSGSTTVSWASMTDAPYTATLTLSNSWGKDVKEVQIFDARVKLDEAGDIIEDLSVYPNPFVESVHVRFVEGGNYDLEVLSLSGQLIQSNQLNVQNSEIVAVNLNAETGMYVVRLKKDGKFIKSFKLEKK